MSDLLAIRPADDGDRHGNGLVDHENLLRVTATSDGYEPELRARATS